jgi:short subunit dehydrogenase-like uncharacterized protein
MDTWLGQRAMDLVLFGATGFTGRLVADYLRDKNVEWAIAGRDRKKLEALGVGVPILVADANDPASLEAIVKQTKVVCTTVGPYAKYGSPVVAACARNGVHYCDLAGETQWIRKMIDAHHEEAKRTGARIVPCCGFDSIPSDLGTWIVQEHAKKAHGEPCESVTFAMGKTRGGFSGGTIASMLNIFDEAKRDRAVRKVLLDPYSLNPAGERGLDGADQRGVVFDRDLDAWTAPFIMAAINTRVVRRTNALGGYPYGRSFRYREVMAFPRGPRGFAMASGVVAAIGGFIGASAIGPVRKLLERMVLPAPGEGPDAELREKGFFEVELFGRGRGFNVRAHVKGKGDPGYAATAVMLAESALSLAKDPGGDGGVLTPALAMGNRLIDRLRAAGMTFAVESEATVRAA